jgi:hypothetical protein
MLSVVHWLASGMLRLSAGGCDMPTKKKRSSGKRDTVQTKRTTMYAKRTARGRFKEMDEKGRSLAADRRKKAKTATKSGYGDRGDRRKAA